MFRVQISTENDSFTEDRNGEVARILRELADRLADGYGNGRQAADVHILTDGNGNSVGKAGFGR
jgi:hypothetical protein